MVMGPAAIAPRFGMSSFGIWHDCSISSFRLIQLGPVATREILKTEGWEFPCIP
jgi:hypothetical protein